MQRMYIRKDIYVDDGQKSEMVHFEQLGRFRQVIQGPDGYVYFVTENPGVLYRILPSN